MTIFVKDSEQAVVKLLGTPAPDASAGECFILPLDAGIPGLISRMQSKGYALHKETV